MDTFPEELRESPLPVVALVGHPTLQGPIYTYISQTMTLRTTDPPIPLFNLISIDTVTLPPRSKRVTHSETHPTPGILKANWMHKHKDVLPAVICLLFSWGTPSEDKNWKQREADLVTQFETTKTHCRGRPIKILIVLVVSAPLANDNSFDERLGSLRRRTGLDVNNFFYFNRADVLQSVRRLEKIVLDMAVLYYKEEAHRVKLMRTHLNRVTQIPLLIRLNFKIAYYGDFRTNTQSALKHYTQAYNNLRDMRGMDLYANDNLRLQEMKVIASYINFKIGRIYFQLNTVPDAVISFQRHIQLFKGKVGYADREYEHWSWVSREYQIMGELLDLFPNNPNINRGYSHPGYYYQYAAKYAIDRKKHAKRQCEPFRDSPKVDNTVEKFNPFTIDQNQTFIGQPPLSLAHPLEMLDSAPGLINIEEDLFHSISQELVIDHTAIIIDLLTTAWMRYKKPPKSKRMILYIASQMVQEHYMAKQWNLAKRFLDKITKSYRKEQWYSLLTHNLIISLSCAHHLSLSSDYLLYALELISPHMTTPLDEKNKLQEQILTILSNPSSFPSPLLPFPGPISISVHSPETPTLQNAKDSTVTNPLIDVKVQFTQPLVFAQVPFQFLIRLETFFPRAIRFKRLKVNFSEPRYNQEKFDPLKITDVSNYSDNPDSLLFLPNTARVFTFSMVGIEKLDLECISVQLFLSASDVFSYTPLPITLATPPSMINNTPNINTNFTVHTSYIVFNWEMNKGEREILEEEAVRKFGASPAINTLSFPKEEPVLATPSKSKKGKEEAPPHVPKRKIKFLERSAIKILDAEAAVDMQVSHYPPALLHEYYPWTITITNKDKPIINGTISFSINTTNQNNANNTTTTSPHTSSQNPLPDTAIYLTPHPSRPVNTALSFGSVAVNATIVYQLYIYSSTLDERQVVVTLSYQSNSPNSTQTIHTTTTRSFYLPVQVPFTARFHFFTRTLQPVATYTESVTLKEPLLLNIETQTTTPYPLILTKSKLVINNVAEPPTPVANLLSSSSSGEWTENENGYIGEVNGVVLQKSNKFTEWFHILPLITGDAFSLGTLHLQWKRLGYTNEETPSITQTQNNSNNNLATPICEIMIPLPSLKISRPSFTVDVDTPSSGTVGVVLPHSLTITNHTNLLQEFTLSILGSSNLNAASSPGGINKSSNNTPTPITSVSESGEVFLISGDKITGFAIHPHGSYTVKYNLIPLQAGKHPLPQVQITSKRFNKELPQVKNTARLIFIKPNSSNTL